MRIILALFNMKKLSYIIIDDDEMYCDYTNQQLELVNGLNCLGICSNAIEAREKILELQPDFIVVDIEMPNLSGIDLVRSLKSLPLIIFVTSHPNFATDAFDVDAVDYLLKPVTNERMFRAIDKLRFLTNSKLANLGQENFSTDADGSFFIKDNSVYTKIAYQNTIYFESLGDFTTIYLTDGEQKIVLTSLKSIEQQLPQNNFIRISRSHIININKVSKLDSDTVYLEKIHLTIGKTFAEKATKSILGNQVLKRFI